MPRKPPLLGREFRKVQPKLRLFSNAKSEVSAVRADFSPALQMAPSYKLADKEPPSQTIEALAVTAETVKKNPVRGSLTKLPSNVLVSVFVEHVSTAHGDSSAPGSKKKKARITRTRGRLATMEVPVSALPKLADDSSVVRIELGETLKHPRPRISQGDVSPPAAGLRRFGASGGKNVLIGIVDVEGFDFTHPDFLEADGKTRFVRIWDQGGNHRPPPKGFDYGAELEKGHLDDAIKASADEGIAPQLLERQSAMMHGSHGTHVASIAAGNRGVCRNAYLAGVLIDLDGEMRDRRRSFSDSTRIAHAVDYLLQLAERIKKEEKLESLPVSINISLGTNGHAHDGSAAVSRWIEHVLSTPGIAITVAAGNAGQERGETADDIGYIMGRIHTSGVIAARGLVNDIQWEVVGNGVMDVSENELEIWYSPADRFAISVKPPGEAWIGPIRPGQFIENRLRPDKSMFSVYNELYHRANGANYIGVYLSPFFSSEQIVGIKRGTWTVRLHGDEVRDGRYHAWIERDDPVELGRHGDASAWRFPSFFAEQSNVDDSSVSSLGCGEHVICVGNLDEIRQKINISSSQGPTRDGRLKPDIAAPGTDIVAALGFNFDDEKKWVGMSGTSMASPFVCGVAGLMLAENPNLTAAQIRGILKRTGRPLPNTDFRWRNDSGYGAIDPQASLDEVRRLAKVEDLT